MQFAEGASVTDRTSSWLTCRRQAGPKKGNARAGRASKGKTPARGGHRKESPPSFLGRIPGSPARRAPPEYSSPLPRRHFPMYQHIKVPSQGQKITVNADMSLNVPDEPIIPFIEGDGTGMDITPVMLKVVD